MMAALMRALQRGRTWVIAVPYLWMLLFFFIPFAIVLKISLADSAIAIPPYTDLLNYEEGVLNIQLNLGNYLFLLEDDLYFLAYLSSVKMAFVSTLLCLLIGYPMAYFIARSTPSVRNVLLMLVILPSWTSFLIRVYAWMGILKSDGLVNSTLISLGVIDLPLTILHTDVAVYIGIVYAYLPFMILPLYANLIKMDLSLLEAAADLGARPWKTFITVTLPLSKRGIIAGSMLVFIPAVGEFVIPALLGGADTLMIGKVLWQEFFNNRAWPIASAVAVIMLLLLVVPIALFNRYQAEENQREE
ncbi:ABC transporter permease subunit [Balneatrix alpica]|uniref:ABC transporter permease subunit n=1 Tax=Balneatrix alpica TaxID=75684 RepID=A0ABV5ZBQ1_9GAMM|nr:ABC transporter permease subunit [Balneatrix alpica]